MKGKLLQKVPEGPRGLLLFFNLSLFINKLRNNEVTGSSTISSGEGKGRQGSPAGVGHDQRCS